MIPGNTQCRIVNIRREPRWDVYIGRGPNPRTRKPGIWGNPFTHIGSKYAQWFVATREDAVDAYINWFQNQQELIDRLWELKGQVLGCWCKPLPCHGDYLVKLVNSLEE